MRFFVPGLGFVYSKSKGKKKMANGAHKGSAFERQICKELSLWWTDGKRDDIFWRTSGSGARSTTRAKTGKSTFEQDGDIQAIDPIGSPFTQLFSVEIKRGYSWDLLDLLSPKKRKTTHPIISFLEQAEASALQGGSMYPMVITKQDRKPTIVIVPSQFVIEYGLQFTYDVEFFKESKNIPKLIRLKLGGWNTPGSVPLYSIKERDVVLMELGSWLEWINPHLLKTLDPKKEDLRND